MTRLRGRALPPTYPHHSTWHRLCYDVVKNNPGSTYFKHTTMTADAQARQTDTSPRLTQIQEQRGPRTKLLTPLCAHVQQPTNARVRTWTADVTPGPNIICSRPMSHLAPSLTKTSSGLMRPLYSLSEILARMSAFQVLGQIPEWGGRTRARARTTGRNRLGGNGIGIWTRSPEGACGGEGVA